ncbi:hypothetical protein LINPERPRIM_LOCUS24844, partial [Linum perenne]
MRNRREAEQHEEFKAKKSKLWVAFEYSYIVKRVTVVYTPKIFTMFQEKYGQIHEYNMDTAGQTTIGTVITVTVYKTDGNERLNRMVVTVNTYISWRFRAYSHGWHTTKHISGGVRAKHYPTCSVQCSGEDFVLGGDTLPFTEQAHRDAGTAPTGNFPPADQPSSDTNPSPSTPVTREPPLRLEIAVKFSQMPKP